MRDIQKRLSAPFYMLASLPFTAMGFGLHIQIAALGAYLSTEKGFDIHEIGFVMAAGPLAGILAQPLVGLISDKAWFWGGRRRGFIIIAGLLAALMFLAFPNIDAIGEMFGLDPRVNIGGMVFLAAFLAVFLDLAINVGMNPARSLMADITPSGDARTKGFTWMQTISGGFALLGSIFGIYYGATPTFYLAFGVILACTLFPVFFIEEPRKLVPDGEQKEAKTGAKSTDLMNVIKIYGAQALTWLGLTVIFFYVFAYVTTEVFGIANLDLLVGDEKKLATENIQSVVFAFFMVQQGAGFFFPKFVLDPLARRFGRVYTHLGAVAVMAIAFGLVAVFGKNPVSLYVLMGVAGLGWASIISLPFAILSEDVAKEKMGLYMGIFNLSIVVPQLIVTLFLGTVVENAANKNLIFIIGAIALGASAILWGFVKEPKKQAVTE